MRRRFFVERFEQGVAVVRDAVAHHLGRVLRARPGQLYELSDGQNLWLGRVKQVAKDRVEFALVEPLPAPTPGAAITLLLALVKFDRFEWALEKAAELGVAEIVPLAAARSEKRLVGAARQRAARWERILLEAAQQARRLRPPVLRGCVPPGSAFSACQSTIKIVFSERPEAPPLRAMLEGRKAPSAAVAIGPEGGWTEEELAAARQAGFAEVSLGPQILRTETAVIAALAVLNYALSP